jgi:hypothetical protein
MNFKVAATKRTKIRAFAEQIWRTIGFAPELHHPFPIVEFLERIMPIYDSDFTLEILSDEEMENGALHGETIPSLHMIRLRESVYNGACCGNGRDRMTVAHEIGHYLMHFDERPTFASAGNNYEIPAYCSSEWQAKAFAGELLVPYMVKGKLSVQKIADFYAVSEEAASFQKYKA